MTVLTSSTLPPITLSCGMVAHPAAPAFADDLATRKRLAAAAHGPEMMGCFVRSIPAGASGSLTQEFDVASPWCVPVESTAALPTAPSTAKLPAASGPGAY